MSEPQYPAIPEPDMANTMAVLKPLKEIAELLTGQAANGVYQAVTAGDLASDKKKIDLLYSQVGNMSALVRQEMGTQVTKTTALAYKYSRVEVQLTDPTTGLSALLARVNTEETARIAGDTASATRLTIVEAQANNTTAGLITANARITTEETARVSGDNALATSISSVSTTVGTNTASINTIQTSVNGIAAKYVLQVNGSGQVAGLQLAAGTGPISTFTVVAEKFALAPQSGGSVTSPFYVTGGITYIDNAVINNFSIGESKLGSNSISASAASSGFSSCTASLGWNPSERLLVICTSLGGNFYVGSQNATLSCPFGTFSAIQPTADISFIIGGGTDPGSASKTYYMPVTFHTCFDTGGSGSGSFTFSGDGQCAITVLRLKK